MASPFKRVATRLPKLLVKSMLTDSNTIAAVPLTVQGLVGQTGDLMQVLDSTGAVLHSVTAAGIVSSPAGAALASPFGLGGSLRMARAKYVATVAADGLTVGTITPVINAIIPDNAIVIGGILNPTTALTSGGSATISVGTSAGSSSASIKALTAVASYSADAVMATVPVFTAASAFKMTAAGSITVSIAVADLLTGGVLEITVFYFVAAA